VHEELRQSASSVLSKIFATMFFLDIEAQEMGKGWGPPVVLPADRPGVEAQSSGFIRSRIRFEGPRSGMICLVLPFALANLMAKNFLGLQEEEASVSQTCDMAGELANIITGNLLPAWDKGGSYALSLPKTEPGAHPEAGHPGHNSQCAIDFDVEGHWVQLSIFFDEGDLPAGGNPAPESFQVNEEPRPFPENPSSHEKRRKRG
jgi:hypothetical protein